MVNKIAVDGLQIVGGSAPSTSRTPSPGHRGRAGRRVTRRLRGPRGVGGSGRRDRVIETPRPSLGMHVGHPRDAGGGVRTRDDPPRVDLQTLRVDRQRGAATLGRVGAAAQQRGGGPLARRAWQAGPGEFAGADPAARGSRWAPLADRPRRRDAVDRWPARTGQGLRAVPATCSWTRRRTAASTGAAWPSAEPVQRCAASSPAGRPPGPARPDPQLNAAIRRLVRETRIRHP